MERKKSRSWPFKDMRLGEKVRIKKSDGATKGQVYAHCYGRQAGKKFETWSDGDEIVFKLIAVSPDGVLEALADADEVDWLEKFYSENQPQGD